MQNYQSAYKLLKKEYDKLLIKNRQYQNKIKDLQQRLRGGEDLSLGQSQSKKITQQISHALQKLYIYYTSASQRRPKVKQLPQYIEKLVKKYHQIYVNQQIKFGKGQQNERLKQLSEQVDKYCLIQIRLKRQVQELKEINKKLKQQNKNKNKQPEVKCQIKYVQKIVKDTCKQCHNIKQLKQKNQQLKKMNQQLKQMGKKTGQIILPTNNNAEQLKKLKNLQKQNESLYISNLKLNRQKQEFKSILKKESDKYTSIIEETKHQLSKVRQNLQKKQRERQLTQIQMERSKINEMKQVQEQKRNHIQYYLRRLYENFRKKNRQLTCIPEELGNMIRKIHYEETHELKVVF